MEVSSDTELTAPLLSPFLVVLYTAVGGLKATFLTDFLHTAIALILIIYLTISVLTHQHVGGFSGLYNQLLATAGENIVPDNYAGSLLTFKSKGAIIFGIILKFGNLALVIMVNFSSHNLLLLFVLLVLIAPCLLR